METSKIIKYAIIGLVVIGIFGIFSSVISTSNQEIDLKNRFKQKMDERTAFYDKMWKTISQKSQIAVKNDSSFVRNVNIIMAGRKDSQGVVMKWVQETNPNANFNQVTALYADLSRTIEGERDGFFMQEKMIMDIVLAHDNIMSKFPSGFILRSFMGRTDLKYKPITSDQTDEVIKTGKDNNTKVF
jgi:hypothetical protein